MSKDTVDKAGRFRTVAERRTNNAIKAMRSLRKLATPTYEYTDDQAEELVQALREELDKTEQSLRDRKAVPEREFQFSDTTPAR